MERKKELLPVAGEPMIRTVVSKLLGSRNVEEVIVVLGHEANAVGAALSGITDERLELIGNARYSEGMGTSLAHAARACAWGAEAIAVVLGDAPFFRTEDLDALVDAHADGAAIAVPVFQGRRGHPVVLDSSFREEMEGLTGDAGARHILERESASVVEVELTDDGFLVDIDDPDDYEAVKNGIGTR
ncbi:MAG: nucleotidyltransferase family protein, partial [Candidatus Eisenbacteria bacterium]